MRIDLKCAVCGGNNFKLDGQLDENAQIKCEDCGHEIGSLAELKERLADEVMKRALPRHSG